MFKRVDIPVPVTDWGARRRCKNHSPESEWRSYYSCTRIKGHTGQHEGGFFSLDSGREVYRASWDNDDFFSELGL